MVSSNDFSAIAALDLDPIKVKLMHKESGEGWTLEYANMIEFEYRRFLYLMTKFPNEPAAPLFDVDVFWHYHILDTMKYAADCEHVFGYFLHHFPYVGLRDAEDVVTHQRAGVRMQELYEGTFGEPYVRAMPDGTGAGRLDSVTQGTAAARSPQASAYSWVVSQEAVAVADKTAYSWVVSQEAAAAVGKTAYSWVVGQDAVAAAQMPMAVAGPDRPIDLAALRRLYFERPVLVTA